MPKRKKYSQNERNFIALRAHGCCEYCMIRHDYSPDTFEIEHIISLFEGGSNELINLAFSCSGCNNRKSFKIRAIDPLTKTIVQLFNPRTDKWIENFEWLDDFSIIRGISPKGRATIELLQLNRKGVVNLRRALYAFGVHPVTKIDTPQ